MAKKVSSHHLFMTITGQHTLTALFYTQILTFKNMVPISFDGIAGYADLEMTSHTVHWILFALLPVAFLL